jgi:hypothetical protein
MSGRSQKRHLPADVRSKRDQAIEKGFTQADGWPLQPHARYVRIPQGVAHYPARPAANQASHMLASNVHPKIERLGHSSIATTLDIYSHLMPNMQEGAAATVDGLLRAAINKRADDVG